MVLEFLIWIQAVNVPSLNQQSASDWQEHSSADGRR